MGSEGDGRSHLHQKLSETTDDCQCSSTSLQDSCFDIPILPAELITEILLRLPVKSLLKFRCVSKSWLALLSSPEFVKSHLSISANNKDNTHHRLMLKIGFQSRYPMECSVSSLLSESVTSAFDLDCPMIKPHEDISINIMGSINGLLCVTIGNKTDLFLWNPSLRKFKKLPDTFVTFAKKINKFCNIDVVHYLHYDFGYDELHDDYKVLGNFNMFGEYEVMIYSLNSDSWKSVDNYPGEFPSSSWRGVSVNGKLHWLTKHGELRHIISFDLGNEKWGKLERPCCVVQGIGTMELGVLGRDLFMLNGNLSGHADVLNFHARVDYWVMKEYGVNESWTKLFTIKLPSEDMGYRMFAPFFISNEGEILFKFKRTFMIYNSKDGYIRRPKVTNWGDFRIKTVYIESLVGVSFLKEPMMQRQQKMKKLKTRIII